MEIKLETLTPIWTGGVETGKMDRIHETGIIGSLRWWYEAIVRGLGGWACDPSKHECIYDPKKPNNSLCDACYVFGATGWRRCFRLLIKESSDLQNHPLNNIVANREYEKTQKNGSTKKVKPTWYFRDAARTGNLIVQVQSLHPEFEPEIIQGLIQLMADWAAIGARPQMGFGVFQITSERLQKSHLTKDNLRIAGSPSVQNLPSIQNMFFARIQKSDTSDQETFNLKYDLRRLFANNKNVRHYVMGTVKDERTGSKVFMSRPYAVGLMRVWGWIPEQANVWDTNWNRQTVLNNIKEHLKTHYDLKVWREFNSTRDTSNQYSDAQEFLNSLWESEE